MSWRILPILASIVAAALVYYGWGASGDTLASPPPALARTALRPIASDPADPALASAPATEQNRAAAPPALEQAAAAGDGGRPELRRDELATRLALALAGDTKHDLRAALQSLGRQCDIQARNPCLDALLAQLPAEQQARLTDILSKLPQVQARLSDLQMSSQQPMLDRLAAISAVRREVLGADNAALLYGSEESYLRYQATLDHFLAHEAPAMSLAQRLGAAEALRQRELGPYLADDTRADQARALRYQATLALTLLDAPDDATRQALARQVRGQFFSQDQVDQMASNEDFDARQRQRALQYQTQKQAILARFATRSDAPGLAQREAELATLRTHLFPDSFQP